MTEVDHRGPIELPNYRFKELLDRGGMGAVYLAEQVNPQREVAIKVITPEDLPRASPEVLDSVLEMLQHEGNIAARFNHENLITVHECGVVGDHYYLAMEYLPGGSLRDRLGTGLDPEEACTIVGGIARGLAEMHSDGVLHRDIKPENILFRKNGRPVLMDYGVAKDSGTISKLTQLGLSTGTPEYMSPEQVDDRPVDTRSDLYALGVLLYEMLTGEVPFTGSSAMAVGYAHVHHPVPRLPQNLERYQPLIDRLLAKDPDDRFQSAEEVIAALDPARADTGSPTRVTPVGTGRPRATMLGELKRRKVLHTAGFYGVTAFGITEILGFIIDNFGLPGWTTRLMAALFVAGFPIAMLLSWAFDIEPGGGIRRTRFRGQSTKPIVSGAVLLLIVSTAGLYYLIKPQNEEPLRPGDATIVESGSEEGPETKANIESRGKVESKAEAPPNSVAVLPFADMSPGQDQAFFAEGLSDTLISLLAQVSGLKVSARNSSFAFRDEELSTGEIATRLGVLHVLVGSVQRSGDRVRVNAQLIDARNDLNIWTDVFDAGSQDIFAIQDQIAGAVIEALQVNLLDSEQQRLAQRYQPKPGAYEQLILGRQEQAKRTIESLNAAQRHLELAIELDPDYALAHVELANVLGTIPQYSTVDAEAYGERARKHIERALELDPNCGEAYAARATQYRDGPQTPEEDFLKALELNPNYAWAHYYYGWLLIYQNREQEAKPHLLRAAELDPMAPLYQSAAAMALFYNGENDAALERAFQNVERQPDAPQLYTDLFLILSPLGRHGEAQRWIAAARRISPSADMWEWECIGFLHLGDPEASQACIDEFERTHPGRWAIGFAKAWLLSYLGEWDELRARLEALEKAPPGARTDLADILVRQGEFEGALKLMAETFPQWQEDDPQVASNIFEISSATTFASILNVNGELEKRDRLLDAVDSAMTDMQILGSDYSGYQAWKMMVHAVRGDRDGAVAALREAVDAGWRDVWWRYFSSWQLEQAGLIEDPEFAAMMEEVKADIDRQREWFYAHKDEPLF